MTLLEMEKIACATLRSVQQFKTSTSEQYLISVKFTVAVTAMPVLFSDRCGCCWLGALAGYQSPGLRG